MDLKTIETYAKENRSLPDKLNYIEQALFLSLRALYNDFRHGRISHEDAKVEKKKILSANETMLKQDLLCSTLLAKQQEHIRKSEIIVNEIMHDIKSNKSVDDLYVKCIKCIGELIGNDVLNEVCTYEGDKL